MTEVGYYQANAGVQLKAGKILKRLEINGKPVIIRTITWDDLDELLVVINSVIEEKADLLRSSKISRDEEIKWLSQRLVDLEREDAIPITVEVEKKVVASIILTRHIGYSSHVGEIGIVIRADYRDLGIGTEAMYVLIAVARRLGITRLTLSVYATNSRAIHVYKKVGFQEKGRLPGIFLRNSQYIDEIIMVKSLEEPPPT